MSKFLLKWLIFFLICLGLAYVLDYMIQEGLKTSNYREVTKWNEVIEGGINAEILIVGSSRALVHFDCEYIEKATGKTCYNLGFDGTTYPLQKLMLELYLSNNIKPKELIWSLDYHSFTEVSDYYGFEQLIPYRENSYVQKMLSMHETPNYQFQIPLFRYSYNPKMKVIGLYSFFGKYRNNTILKKGFRKQNKVWDGSFDKFREQNPQGVLVDFEKNLFSDFINLNRDLIEKVKVTWIISPYYFDNYGMINNHNDIQKKWEEAAKPLNVTYSDFSQNKISYDKANFYNSSHLNAQGVQKFMDAWIKF